MGQVSPLSFSQVLVLTIHGTKKHKDINQKSLLNACDQCKHIVTFVTQFDHLFTVRTNFTSNILNKETFFGIYPAYNTDILGLKVKQHKNKVSN